MGDDTCRWGSDLDLRATHSMRRIVTLLGTLRRNPLGVSSVLLLGLLLAACAPNSPVAPTIQVQPSDKTVSPGQSTTFSVQASDGGAEASYQWTWNGFPIEGETGSSFTTRSAETVDDGSTFAVTITNPAGSVTSREATLTVSPVPRAPRRGDLRFKGVGAVPFREARVQSTITCSSLANIPGVGGTPLALSAGSAATSPAHCRSWAYATTELPANAPSESVEYVGHVGSIAMPDLMDQAYAGNGVVTSLDLVDGNDNYAWSQVKSAPYDYATVWYVVLPEDVATYVEYEGAHARIVTAVASHAGAAWIVSYDWRGDTTTVFETSVRGATAPTLGQVASELSGDGYIITAVGRDGTGGLLLVGYRQQGDTMARPLAIANGVETPTDLLGRGYAIVAYVFDTDTGTWTWVGQQ